MNRAEIFLIRSWKRAVSHFRPDINIRDFFGMPVHGGRVTALCSWRVPPRLARLADGEPIMLSSRVFTGAGEVVDDNGPRSRLVEPKPSVVSLPVPIEVPYRPGEYRVEIDSVVEHRFWGSWYGEPFLSFAVTRQTDGRLEIRSRRRFTVAAPAVGARFRPPHPMYGIDDTERAVEIPWALSRWRVEHRRVLDVGYAHAEQRYLAGLTELRIPAIVGIDLLPRYRPPLSPVCADVRCLPFRDGSFELILAISVLEHIGRDNVGYLEGQRDRQEPHGDLRVAEQLSRLVAPGGLLILTVPYGRGEDLGWQIQYDQESLRHLIEATGLRVKELEFYGYDDGWHGPSPAEALGGKRYSEGAIAASGVACLALTTPD